MGGVNAFGTVFERAEGVGWEALGSMGDLEGPSRSREALETTAHDSPDGYREFIKGLKDGGEVTMTVNYDPRETSHQSLDDDYENDENVNYRIRLLPDTPDEYTWAFSGIITDLGDSYPVDDIMERDVTIKISGKPTLTATP